MAVQKEIWVEINKNYSISSFGNVRSNRSNKILKPGIRGDGYLVVNITGYKHKKNWKIHQLVAHHFLEKIENKTQINHKNGIKSDNRVENLEWCTCSENIKHAFRTGLRQPVINKGLKNGFSKLVLDVSTGIFYESCNEASELLGYNPKTLSAILNGQNKNRTTLKYV